MMENICKAVIKILFREWDSLIIAASLHPSVMTSGSDI